MRSPEAWIGALRLALTRLGVQARRAPEAGDDLPGSQVGTARMVINSRCGRAADRIRPGIALGLNHAVLPDPVAAVCTGADLEATARAREDLQGDPPSSPSGALCSIV